MIPYTLNENGVTFFFQGRQRTISSDHCNYDQIIYAVTQNTSQLESLLDIKKFVVRISLGDVSICSDDVVRYQGTPVPDYLAHRILQHYNDKIPVEPICKFAEKLMQNPNKDVREDLYRWLEAGSMPIYPDGDFAAYKLVREDFSPIHKGPFGQDQSPGQIVEMPRDRCDENRDHTCSTGLHFCSYEYLPVSHSWNNYQGNKVILLKINPRDVVSIPTDYNLSKGRTCRFEVVSEISLESVKEDFGDKLVLYQNSQWWDDNEDFEDDIDDDLHHLNRSDVEQVEKETEQMKTYPNNVTPAAVANAIAQNDGNKSAAARALGISRSTLYRILDENPLVGTKDPLRLHAEELLERHGTKTAAAEAAGVSRSTLSRWLER